MSFTGNTPRGRTTGFPGSGWVQESIRKAFTFPSLITVLLWVGASVGLVSAESVLEVIEPGASWTVPSGKILTLEQLVRIGQIPDDYSIPVIMPQDGGTVRGHLPARGAAFTISEPMNLRIPAESRFENPDSNPTRIAVLGTLAVVPEEPEASPVGAADYYSGITGSSGAHLKTLLHERIRDHRVHSYEDLWVHLRRTDADPANPDHVLLLYSGWSLPHNRNGGRPSDWNREHTWPKSHGGFSSNSPMATDLHHIRPTDVSVNSRRGHRNFDEGGDWYEDPDGPTRNRVDLNSWEPREEVKGDIARMLFYMAVRYEGTVDGEPDLELNDRVSNLGQPRIGKISVLLEWHQEDPVDELERTRNQRIYEIQGNRNPFIDHPEWVERIWGY